MFKWFIKAWELVTHWKTHLKTGTAWKPLINSQYAIKYHLWWKFNRFIPFSLLNSSASQNAKKYSNVNFLISLHYWDEEFQLRTQYCYKKQLNKVGLLPETSWGHLERNFTKLPEPFFTVFCIRADADPNRWEHHLHFLGSIIYIFCL